MVTIYSLIHLMLSASTLCWKAAGRCGKEVLVFVDWVILVIYFGWFSMLIASVDPVFSVILLSQFTFSIHNWGHFSSIVGAASDMFEGDTVVVYRFQPPLNNLYIS